MLQQDLYNGINMYWSEKWLGLDVCLPSCLFPSATDKTEGGKRKIGSTPCPMREGEKEIIPQFHDESCLMVNDYKAKAWPPQVFLIQQGDLHLQIMRPIRSP